VTALERAENPGHRPCRHPLDHVIDGMPLEDLAGQPFGWQPGWEYRLP
jgi:hypothetical protein